MSVFLKFIVVIAKAAKISRGMKIEDIAKFGSKFRDRTNMVEERPKKTLTCKRA
jgi:hypothetical protein